MEQKHCLKQNLYKINRDFYQDDIYVIAEDVNAAIDKVLLTDKEIEPQGIKLVERIAEDILV